MEELPAKWKEPIVVLIYIVIKQNVVISGAYYFYNVHKNFILHSSLKDNSMYRENYWNFQCGFRRNRPTTDCVFCIFQVPEKKREYKKPVHHLFIEFKKAYDSLSGSYIVSPLIAAS